VSGEEEIFDFDHFNAKQETFPYDDESFDVVLCCEILEHLPKTPVNLLAETHQVLRKPSGVLPLTTPNAVRTDNLIRLIRGRNVYEQISGYGVYGRHNREYTLKELGDLLTQCGFEVLSLFAADTQPGSERLAKLTRLAPATREDRLFALARPVGEPRWRYPDWLYASKHALRRVVRPDLVMGLNDDLQAFGFHELLDRSGRCVRWTGPASAAPYWSESVRPRGVPRIVNKDIPDVEDEPLPQPVRLTRYAAVSP
jgi:SAM-dependent methyltransferase